MLQGYAAVFCVMVRLRRVEQLLLDLHAPLMQQVCRAGGLWFVLATQHRRCALRPAVDAALGVPAAATTPSLGRGNHLGLLKCLPPPLDAILPVPYSALCCVQPRSAPGQLLEEEEADRAIRRVQCLRAFHHGTLQLVAALQLFLQSRVSGGLIEGVGVCRPLGMGWGVGTAAAVGNDIGVDRSSSVREI